MVFARPEAWLESGFAHSSWEDASASSSRDRPPGEGKTTMRFKR